MFVKLFSRVTESSLMEETIETRYVFIMLLTISNPHGLVVGTDIAIARRINIATDKFEAAIKRLMAPDLNSNSKENDGRRLVMSEGERGYQIVNYLKYRSMRDEEGRREYMTGYMADYRAKGKDKSRPVNSVNNGKRRLAYAEAESKSNSEEKRERSIDRSSSSFPKPKNGKLKFEDLNCVYPPTDSAEEEQFRKLVSRFTHRMNYDIEIVREWYNECSESQTHHWTQLKSPIGALIKWMKTVDANS